MVVRSLEPTALAQLFEPRSIAVIGASDNPARIGGRPIAGCMALGYEGGLYPVNPSRTQVQGLRCYPDVMAIGQAIDLAVIALPAGQCEAAIAQCAQSGVKAAIMLSAGFAEVDEAGAALQERIRTSARIAGIRLMGPNCMGLLNLRIGLVASFTSLVDGGADRIGHISVISQSGAFGSHCLALMRERGLGLDLWATTGNQADVDFADGLAWMAQAANTRVIVGCLEGVTDGTRLRSALALAQRNRIPVVLMKLGRSDVGRAAALTHTAALAGSDAVFNAMVRDYAVHRANDVDELFDIAYACTAGKFPASGDIGLITTSGGFGIVMADAAAAHGLAVPALPAATQSRLKALVPFASPRNPLDVTGQFINDPSAVLPMFEALINDGGFPATVCYIGSAGVIPHLMAKLVPSFEAVAQRYATHLLVLSMIADTATRKRFEALGYLVFENPERAVGAVAVLARFARQFGMRETGVTELPEAIAAPVAGDTMLDEAHSKRVLAQAGIPVLDERISRSADEAAAHAGELGFPVAMKILSPDILHKSDIGGVLLGIPDPEAAMRAFRQLHKAAQAGAPDARIDGVLVAPMADDGIEMIVGCAQDEAFGPVVMIGLGGIFVEALASTALRLAPIDHAAAHSMINELQGAAVLRGLRGKPPADVAALANVLVVLSRFAAANEAWLASIDINPLVVRAAGRGVVALDAVVVTRG